jgi:hypothetical protein
MMKKLILSAALAAAGLAGAQAFTYKDADLLLVFRQDGYNDVVFNIGSVTNFTGLPNGTVKLVANWSATLAVENFDGTLDGSKFAVVATSSPQATASKSWLTDADDLGLPAHVTYSKWSLQYSSVAAVGRKAAELAAAGTNAFVRDPSDSHSYTYIVSQAGNLDPATLGGASTFPVEQDITGSGATLRFFEIWANKSAAIPQQIGSFTITVDGELSFIAGSSAVAPTITTAPTGQTVNLGSPATMFVAATGTQPFGYQWRRNGVDLAGQNSDTFSIGSASAADAGNYTVVVSNLGGAATNNPPAVLRVLVPPVILGESRTGNTFTARVQSVSGLNYRLEYKNVITTAGWTPVLPSVVGTGAQLNLTDPTASVLTRFYRVRAD